VREDQEQRRPPRPVEPRPFEPESLVELAEQGVPPPSFVVPEFLYRSCCHALQGPPESGKTTVLAWWMLERLRAGERVAFLDEESGREHLVERLTALGVKPAELAGLDYFEFPGRRWDQPDKLGLANYLQVAKPSMLAADSMAAMLTVAGKSENEATDVRAVIRDVLTLSARTFHLAAVYLDHKSKDGEESRYARGSGDKLGATDVAWNVQLKHSFNRTESGRLVLSVAKDRRGFLHRSWSVEVAVSDGRMRLGFSKTEGGNEEDPLGLRPADRRVLDALRSKPGEFLSAIQIGGLAASDGNRPASLRGDTIRKSCRRLVDRGLADEAASRSGEAKYWSAKRDESIN